MPRASTSSQPSLPTPYHLRTPPARQLGVPITVVIRGHRARLPASSHHAILTSSPIPTEPESSPFPQLSGRYGLRRSRTVSKFDQHNAPKNHSYMTQKPATSRELASNTVTTEGGNESSVVDLGFEPLDSPRNRHIGLVTVESGDDESPVVDYATSITGLELGQGLFNPVDPIAMGIPVFDAPMSLKDVMWLRTQLDLSNNGITPTQFRDMFGQCEECDRFMMIRSKDQHACPGRSALPQVVSDDDKLFCLLNVTGGGQGLTPKQFRYLFVSCFSCKRIFTRMTASHHIHLESE